MQFPFTTEQFFSVFREYNLAVWPAPVVLTILVVVGSIAIVSGAPWATRAMSVTLALVWCWTAIVYHALYFAAINPAAPLFAALFGAQAILLLYMGGISEQFVIRFRPTPRGVAGIVLQAYALAVYPLLSSLSSHAYPSSPTFGLPCPSTIYTLGVLLWIDGRTPWQLLVVPVLWTVIGTTAAFRFGVLEDVGLAAAVVVTLVFWIANRRPLTTPATLHKVAS